MVSKTQGPLPFAGSEFEGHRGRNIGGKRASGEGAEKRFGLRARGRIDLIDFGALGIATETADLALACRGEMIRLIGLEKLFTVSRASFLTGGAKSEQNEKEKKAFFVHNDIGVKPAFSITNAEKPTDKLARKFKDGPDKARTSFHNSL